MTLMLNGSEFTHSFLVCTLPTKAAGLLDTDFLDRLGARVDFKCGQMTLTGIEVVPRVHCIPSTEHVALTAFSEGKEGRSPQPKKCDLVMVANFSEEELVIPKATVCGVVQASESLTDRFSTTSERSSDSPARQPRKKKSEKLWRGKLDFIVEHRAESKKGHVDALSSHVATAVQGGTLDKVKVPRKQARDTPCAKREVRNPSQKTRFLSKKRQRSG